MLWMLLAASFAGEPVAWSDLTPWRTWVLVDDVSLERQWFVMPVTPGRHERCEVGVVPGKGAEGAVVHCGEAQISDVGIREPPRAMRKTEKAARKALQKLLGTDAREIAAAEMSWLGRLRRVSFRQAVITRASEGDARNAHTFVHATFWDVDLDTGRVDRGVVGSRVAEEPLCVAGRHAHCGDTPRLLGFVPQPGWDGHLIDVEADGSQGAQTKELEELIREVAMIRSNDWLGVPMRAPGEGLLPPDMDAGMSMQLVLDVQRFDGTKERRKHTLDLPLNEAAFEGVALSFPVDGTDARIQVDAKLQDGAVKVLIGSEGTEDPAALVMPVDCSLVLDGSRAAAAQPCPVRHMLRQVTWVGEGGVQRVTVTASDRLLPMLGPSQGPAVR